MHGHSSSLQTHVIEPGAPWTRAVWRGEESFVGAGQEKEGQTGFGCMKEPQASHLGPIKSAMFLATIYKTDGPKMGGVWLFCINVQSEEAAWPCAFNADLCFHFCFIFFCVHVILVSPSPYVINPWPVSNMRPTRFTHRLTCHLKTLSLDMQSSLAPSSDLWPLREAAGDEVRSGGGGCFSHKVKTQGQVFPKGASVPTIRGLVLPWWMGPAEMPGPFGAESTAGEAPSGNRMSKVTQGWRLMLPPQVQTLRLTQAGRGGNDSFPPF